jgi:DNA-binding NarL/FixJ family response regulator
MTRDPQRRNGKARLFLADDEPLVRRGLEVLLSAQPEFEVCGRSGETPEALKQASALEPDLAVVDLSFKMGNGFDLIRDLRRACPRMKVLVFSMHDQPTTVAAAFKAGAHGYLTKDEGAEKMVEAIQSLLAGLPYLTDTLAARLPRTRRAP